MTGVSLVWAFIGGLGRTVVKAGGARFNPDDIALDGDDTKATVVNLLSGPNDGITLISDAFLLDASDKQVSSWTGAAGTWSVIGTIVTYTPTTPVAQAVARYVLALTWQLANTP